ncbi:hypothetical protein FQN54_002996 [Arachnomyces sp. PD_36]|nr:hypothetical protein FQN54_002996 [Arachnomyces sp. PD_36]
MAFGLNYEDCLSQLRLETSPGPATWAALFFLLTGGLVSACTLLSYVRALFSLFILPGKSLRKFGSKGSWALVTGASDGIGKEFSLQLAQAGFNIVLVSRTESKLTTLASEIESKYSSVRTKTLAMDYADNSDADYEQLEQLVNGLDISVLVNNVGKSHNIPVPFVQTPDEELEDIITINCLGTLRTTKIVAPGMIQRKRGLILTMGSFGGLLPTPLLATYSGSKAFLQQWSTALGAELEPHGVQVELVQSYLVTSSMSKIRRASATIPNPRNFVRSVLGKIGRSGGSPSYAHTSSPFWSHGLMAWWLTTILGTMNKTVLGFNGSMHNSIRQRALKKMEREKGKKAA